jgi:Na+-transporting NADH:ubiquinone oxidoreductase subunit NqrC
MKLNAKHVADGVTGATMKVNGFVDTFTKALASKAERRRYIFL